MIQYRVDAKPVSNTNTQIKDMLAVLREIPVTYQLLLKAIEEQEVYLSLPSIDAYRDELEAMVKQSISLANSISENSEKLVIISEQASKHLTAFENHFSAALEKHIPTEAKTEI